MIICNLISSKPGWISPFQQDSSSSVHSYQKQILTRFISKTPRTAFICFFVQLWFRYHLKLFVCYSSQKTASTTTSPSTTSTTGRSATISAATATTTTPTTVPTLSSTVRNVETSQITVAESLTINETDFISTNGLPEETTQTDFGDVTVPVTTTVQPPVKNDCPVLEPSMISLTQEQLTSVLTNACSYDKLVKPPTKGALPVYMQIDLTHIESSDQLQFKAHILVQYVYKDVRLKYDHILKGRGNLLGEELLRNKIWVPHITVRNERDTKVMGIDGKDVFVSISPSGDVVYSYRMSATFYCWMNLQKFPFDTQDCFLRWNSCKYLDLVLVPL
jgi:hypothetical protein